MAPARRAPMTPAAPPAVGFLDLEFYGGGFNLPEGDYAAEFEIMMHHETKQDGTPLGPDRLGVMITFYPLAGGGDPIMRHLSMGQNSHTSFQPNPNDGGKSLVAVPGGPGQQPNNMTNWALFLKSLYDCGMPKGVVSTFADLDGVWIHTRNVPEPEERKGFATSTGEVQQQSKGPKLIPAVTEIKEGGKPWEGGGGIPTAQATPAAAPVPGPTAVRRIVAPVLAAAIEEPAQDDDFDTIVVNAIADVLQDPKRQNGTPKMALRTEVFKVLGKSHGQEVAQKCSNDVFGNDAALNAALASLGYGIQGAQVKPLT